MDGERRLVECAASFDDRAVGRAVSDGRSIPRYAPRRTRFHDVRRQGEWQLKLYSIVAGAAEVDWTTYESVWPLVMMRSPRRP